MFKIITSKKYRELLSRPTEDQVVKMFDDGLKKSSFLNATTGNIRNLKSMLSQLKWETRPEDPNLKRIDKIAEIIFEIERHADFASRR